MSPLQKIWFLEVQGVLGALLGLSPLVDHWVLGALGALLCRQSHIHPAEGKKNRKLQLEVA